MEWWHWLLGAVVAIACGLSLYLLWDKHSGKNEDSPLKVILLFSPSFWVIVSLMAWGGQSPFLPLDLMSLTVAIFVFSLILVLALVFLGLKKLTPGWFWILVLSLQVFSLLNIVFFQLVTHVPYLTIQMAVWLSDLSPESFWSKWLQLQGSGSQVGATVTVFDRVLLAILSYIPLSLMRSFMQNFRLRKIRNKIENQEKRLAVLENKFIIGNDLSEKVDTSLIQKGPTEKKD